MPKDDSIKNVMVIGAGPIVIGQACEFDYSGVQACMALKEKGCRVILVNSNPSTIMTDPDFADATYIEPLVSEVITTIINKEKPDSLLATMGGQTALNCAIALTKQGALARCNVTLLGASYETIIIAENRVLFQKAAFRAGLKTPRSLVIHQLSELHQLHHVLWFPLLLRQSYRLGGSGSAIVTDFTTLKALCEKHFLQNPHREILIEEVLLGWKEFELEVMVDSYGNGIVVCSIENVNPMGIHTGDSVTVTPAQTLTNKEYQDMRRDAFKLVHAIGMSSGGCNVQFAVNPKNGERLVIEINPRVSRSSALASKATGYPIAKVATQLALGYALTEINNEMTGSILSAAFEPSIDYVVTKIPRFHFEKFPGCDVRLGTQMKSVGEVIGIGRSFKESLQKSLNSLEMGLTGLDLLQFYDLTKMDPWFLDQIQELAFEEIRISQLKIESMDKNAFFQLKQRGFSDKRIAYLCQSSEEEIRAHRHLQNVHPVYKHVDPCAGEFPITTAYFYSSYDQVCEAKPSARKKVIVIGSGPNRIGQGIEFDYCCVHAVQTLKALGYESIMINCNPETVSTDFNIADRLYLEPLILENILAIIDSEKPLGVVVQFGGQTPLQLAKSLEKSGVRLIGTSADRIDRAENRQRFKEMVCQLNLKQPESQSFYSRAEALINIPEVNYPLVIRPSYVLGGQSVVLIQNADELSHYLTNIPEYYFPLLMERFLRHAVEVDVDAVSDGDEIYIGGIMQQFEPAGIHSGDSRCSLPPHELSMALQQEIIQQVKKLAHEINIIGCINLQFAIQDNAIYVLEVNPRASRTVPFVSKATGVPLAKIATRCLMGIKLKEQSLVQYQTKLCAVKIPIFSFDKFPGCNSALGIEMKSTGEVMGIGHTMQEALEKAELAAGQRQYLDLTSPISISNIRSLQEIN